MTMGRWLLLGGVFIAATAVAAIPWWVGSEIERQFSAQFERLQKQLQAQSDVSLALESYQQGYLESTAVTTLTIDMSQYSPAHAVSPSPVSIKARHAVTHGPYIDGKFNHDIAAKIISTVIPDSEQQRTLSRFYFGDHPPFEMTTQLAWSGEMSSRGGVPAYSGRDHRGEYDLRWGGLQFESTGNWVAMRGDSELNAPRFELSNASQGITLGGLHGRFASFMSPLGFALGDGELSLALFKLRGKGKRQVTLRDLIARYNLQQQGELVNVMQRFGFRLFEIGGAEYKDGVFQFELNNLDGVVLQSLQRRYDAFSQTHLTDENGIQQWWLAQLRQVLPALLQQAPVLHISRVEVLTVDGLVSGRLKLASKEVPSDLTLVDFESGFAKLLPLLQLELDIRLPARIIERQARAAARKTIVARLAELEQTMTPLELAHQTRRAAEQMLVQFEVQNIIRRHTDYYTATLHFKNEGLILNGVPADNLLSMMPSLKGS